MAALAAHARRSFGAARPRCIWGAMLSSVPDRRCVSEITIRYDPSKEALLMEQNPQTKANCLKELSKALRFYHTCKNPGHLGWPHLPTHPKAKISQRLKKLEPCQIQAFEKAGMLSSVDVGYSWDECSKAPFIDYENAKLVLADEHANTMNNLQETLMMATGYFIYSVPLKVLEYKALSKYKLARGRTRILIDFKAFRVGARRAKKNNATAKIELEEAVNQGVRNAVFVNMEAIGKGKAVIFPPADERCISYLRKPQLWEMAGMDEYERRFSWTVEYSSGIQESILHVGRASPICRPNGIFGFKA